MSKRKSIEEWEYELGTTLTEKYLKTEYIDKKMSINALKNKHNCPREVIEHFLRKFSIPLRSLKESTNTPHIKEQRKATCLKRYGVENPSQDEFIKRKKAETFLKNYGVDNIWKDPNYYSWLDQYMIDTYGKKRVTNGTKISETRLNFSVEKKKRLSMIMSETAIQTWESKTEEEKKEQMVNMRKSIPVDIKCSKLEYRIKQILDDNNIPYIHQYFLSYYSYDFCFLNYVLLEVNGDYWHGNPSMYQSGDIIKQGSEDIMVDQLWDRDLVKKLEAEKYGNKVYYLWESDINSMTDQEILDFIGDINADTKY